MLTDSLVKKGFNYFNELPENGSQYEKLLVLTDSVHPASIRDGRGNQLPKSTRIAIESLSQNDKGFFLMVEGSQIDWGGHGNDSTFLVTEMLDFNEAIKVAFDFADENPETLVVVTADHETGGLTIIENKKANSVRFNFSTKSHSGVMVPVFAYGAGAEKFSGLYENTEIIHKILDLTGLDEPK